jgi:hypothetical protein
MLIDCYFILPCDLYRRYCKNPRYKSSNWIFLGSFFFFFFFFFFLKSSRSVPYSNPRDFHIEGLINDKVLEDLKLKASFECVLARYTSDHRNWLPEQNTLDSPRRGS